MMSREMNSKIEARHLKGNAYLYVRQSTLRQVFENQESTKRQYALRQRAVALGWPIDRIIVIDSDVGQSAASAIDREGFQRLVTEVSMGRAGIVMGLEVSRLARNSTDWHRLLEICALTNTLILDEDGVYDPAHFNTSRGMSVEDNNRRLRENAQAIGADRRHGPPREGPALLQGLAICAACGERMTIRYHTAGGHRVPDYVCQRRGIERAEPVCQQIHGGPIDNAIGKLLVESVTPVTLEVALTVQKELEARVDEADRARRREVESARYDAELARRRYMKVDPDNRMVADTLEADWNARLRALADAQDRLEQHRKIDRGLDEQQRARILALATDFPRLWSDPRTPDRERKRMARLLIEDVTLFRADVVTARVRFRGGATRTLVLPLPKPAWMMRQTSPEVVATIDRLLDEHTDAKIAKLLNERGMTSGTGKPFHAPIVARIRGEYGLIDRYDRLRKRGLLGESEIAKRLHVEPCTIKIWRRAGLLVAHRYPDKGECLYERPTSDAPTKYKHQDKTRGKRAPCSATDTRSN